MKKRIYKSKYHVFALIFLVFVTGAVSCSQAEEISPTDNPGSVPVIDFLEILEMPTTEKLRENELRLYIENKSNDCVVFPGDYGLKIFTKINNTWVEIPNLVDYMDESEIIFTTFSGGHPSGSIYLLPDYSAIDGTPKWIRVLLHAYLCQDEIRSDDMVSDFIDIDLGK